MTAQFSCEKFIRVEHIPYLSAQLAKFLGN